jgi:DedD protein
LALLAEDVNVDELRRRARRRLVGAIVLALAAAVIVPMLLESEQKPLGDDVSVRIPPVDDGKFVNRLNDGKGAPKDAKTAAPPAEPARKSEAAPTVPEAAPPSAPAAATTVPSAPSPAPAAQAESSKSAPSKAAPALAQTQAPAPAKVANGGGFAVQLAAFSDDKGANALAGKLRRAGYEAYTEPLKTSKGTLWRVRVGPYPSREAATAARDKLKGEGQNGIVASVH